MRPHQIEIIGALHGAARKAFLLSAAGLAALPLVLLVLAAALAVEFQLMLHTMVTLLDDGTGNQPITLLGLSSLIAIVALHVLTRQPGSEAIHRWMMRLGLVALVLFLLGLGLIVAMASFEVAAAMLFDPATGIDGLDSWLAGTEREAEDESLVAFLRDLFADYGGLIALVLASLGLGGVFFLTVLVSHFLIGLALKLAGEFITALTRVRESARLKAVMLAADAALAAAAHKVARHNAVSPATAVREAVATLTAKADSALSHPRRVVQAADLIKPDEAGDPLAGLGSKLLGLPAEVGTLDMPALKTLLADLDQAITEDTLFDIALSVAINELGLTDNDREMFDD
ncbi:hypothetical protein CKO24_13100 [Rhodothalassium salexigens DSM 2132]|nr:hypothetical protein [Rhodothalassium salexigens DSM 2132]